MTAVSIAYSSVLFVLKPWQLPRACRWTVLYDTQARIAEKPCARRDLSDRTLSETVAAWGKTCGKLMLTPASLHTFYTLPPFFFSIRIRIPTGVARPVRKIFSLFWVYRGHFHEKPYTINKNCRRCKEFTQVFRQKSRGVYPGVIWIYLFSKDKKFKILNSHITAGILVFKLACRHECVLILIGIRHLTR